MKAMLAIWAGHSQTLGEVTCLIANTGLCSEKNILACEKAGPEPLIAVAREAHHPNWARSPQQTGPLPDNASPTQIMRHRLKTTAARALYALRKQTVEPRQLPWRCTPVDFYDGLSANITLTGTPIILEHI